MYVRKGFAWILFTALFLTAIPASGVAQLSPLDASQQMKRGINLGNTLEPPDEGSWNNGPARESHFDAYVEAGFQTVRIPIRWDEHTLTSSPFTVDSSWMERVADIVDWGLERDLFVIINAHHEEWLKVNYASESTRARFDSIWSQIAIRFREKSEKLLFEIVNEPNGMTRDEVDLMNQRVLAVIRRTNPTRLVIYSGNEYSNSEQLMAAAIPDDDYLMAYYHSYNPWSFAGQGQGTWGSASDRSALRAQIQGVASWSRLNGVPVMVSEFGAVHGADYNSRMRYYQVYVEELIDAGMPFQVWDDGGNFGVLNRNDDTWDETKDILINASSDGPTNFDISAGSDSSVLLSWDNRVIHNRILIQRALANEPFTTIATVSSTSTSFVDSTATPGYGWRYRLIAENALMGDRYVHPLQIETSISRSGWHGYPVSIPGVIEAEHFDIGVEGQAYHDSDAFNQSGTLRTNTGVDIEARSDGGCQVSNVELGEWLEYSITVQQSGSYLVEAEVASLEGGGSIHFVIGEARSGRLSVPTTDSWETTADVSTTLELKAGPQIMRVTVTGIPEYNMDRFRLDLISGTDYESLIQPLEVSIYPNPAKNYITVNGNIDGRARIDVIDLLGRTVLSDDAATATHTVDISNLSPGMYFVILMMGEGLPEKKTIVKL